MHVVIVEDARDIARLLEMMLRPPLYTQTTVCTSDFEGVIDRVRWEEVDAIICDRYLDEISGDGLKRYDGNQILEYLKTNYPHIRRLMMTADDLIDVTDTAAHRVLTKPVMPNVILAALNEPTV